MAQNLDISVLNAVGVYVFEIDASTPPIQLDSQRTRVVVGFSRKGPKNTMVFLRTKQDAINVYGEVDSYLERRGSYFHRSLLTALETGPIFALNLCPVNNEMNTGDKSEYISYSIDTNAKNAFKNEQGSKLNYLYSSFFNQERFWKPDSEYFQSVVDNVQLSAGKYFSIVNLGNTPVTILTRKSSNVSRDFQLTVSEYYGSGKEPLITKPFDYMADYFVDVFFIEGVWDNYEKLAADPIYGSYFDVKGLRKERFDAFIGSDGVNVIYKVTGAILPEVLDKQLVNYSLDVLINNLFISTGMFCTLNDKAIEDYDTEVSTEHIDLIGHNIVSGRVNKVDYLSYNEVIDNITTVNPENAKFKRKVLNVSNLTSNYIGYDIEEVNVTTNDIYKNITVEEISIEPDMSSVPFNTNMYADIGLNYWLYSKNGISNNVMTGSLAYLENKLLFEEGVYPLVETTIIFNKDGENYVAQINKEDLEDFNETIIRKNWFNNITTVSSVNLYEWDTTNVNYNHLSFDDFSVEEIQVSDDTEYLITFVNVRKNGELLSASSYDLIIDPFTVGDINLHTERQELSVVSEINENILIIGNENTKYIDVKNLTDALSFNNTYQINITVDNFNVNDSGTAYKLARKSTLDGTIVLSDVMRNVSDNQGSPLTFISNNLKLDLVDSKQIFTTYEILRQGVSVDVVYVNDTIGKLISVGDYLVANYNGENVLTRVKDKVKFVSEVDATIEFKITTVLPVVVTNNTITKYFKVEEFITHYNLHSLNGFSYNAFHLPDGTDLQMNKIYGMLDPINGNLREILSDRNIIDWRYIIDTFSGGISPNMGGKSQLSLLAQQKKQGLALLNAPAIKDFAECSNPYFTTQPTVLNPKPIINTDFIKDGGNIDLGPSNRFTIPDEEQGGKYCGVFGPYLAVIENGKRKIIPPAADISNNYMRKFRLGQPYAIVAGEPLGIITNPNLVGVEYDLLDRDRANFEKIGINPIVFRDGVIKIFANLTGYQRVVSPLNSLHVRDLLISIENTLINITSRYLFRKNTPSVRLEIQTIVETYLEGVLTEGGITKFRVTIDSSNNTSEIIDQRIAILDVEVVPALGMEKFVNRITIYSNNAAEASGF